LIFYIIKYKIYFIDLKEGDEIMSLEIIRSIRHAEKEADNIVKTSLADERRILANAEKESYRLLEKANEEAEIKKKAIIKKAESDAYKEIEKINNRILKECETIKKEAEQNITNAAEIIAGRIIKSHGYS